MLPGKLRGSLLVEREGITLFRRSSEPIKNVGKGLYKLGPRVLHE